MTGQQRGNWPVSPYLAILKNTPLLDFTNTHDAPHKLQTHATKMPIVLIGVDEVPALAS